jgi:hypothetical protein
MVRGKAGAAETVCDRPLDPRCPPSPVVGNAQPSDSIRTLWYRPRTPGGRRERTVPSRISSELSPVVRVRYQD